MTTCTWLDLTASASRSQPRCAAWRTIASCTTRRRSSSSNTSPDTSLRSNASMRGFGLSRGVPNALFRRSTVPRSSPCSRVPYVVHVRKNASAADFMCFLQNEPRAQARASELAHQNEARAQARASQPVTFHATFPPRTTSSHFTFQPHHSARAPIVITHPFDACSDALARARASFTIRSRQAIFLNRPLHHPLNQPRPDRDFRQGLNRLRRLYTTLLELSDCG